MTYENPMHPPRDLGRELAEARAEIERLRAIIASGVDLRELGEKHGDDPCGYDECES